jgi:hypothetical protein
MPSHKNSKKNRPASLWSSNNRAHLHGVLHRLAVLQHFHLLGLPPEGKEAIRGFDPFLLQFFGQIQFFPGHSAQAAAATCTANPLPADEQLGPEPTPGPTSLRQIPARRIADLLLELLAKIPLFALQNPDLRLPLQQFPASRELERRVPGHQHCHLLHAGSSSSIKSFATTVPDSAVALASPLQRAALPELHGLPGPVGLADGRRAWQFRSNCVRFTPNRGFERAPVGHFHVGQRAGEGRRQQERIGHAVA